MTKMIEESVERGLSELINNDSLQTKPFSEKLNARRLLWTFGLMDDGHEIQLLHGILDTEESKDKHQLFVKLLGDPSYIDVHGNFHKRPQYYQFKIENIDTYYQDSLIQGSARIVFSQSGDWLLIITFEGYALLGATHSLMIEFEKSIPSLTQYYNHQDFIDYWKACAKENGVDISWVGKLLTHINPVWRGLYP